jgi:CBS domain-containing protein
MVPLFDEPANARLGAAVEPTSPHAPATSGTRRARRVTMRLREIMSTDVRTARPNQTADRAWSEMQLRHLRHLVVMDGPQVVGILSERDLGGRHGAVVRRGHTVGDLMTQQVVSAAPQTTLRQASNLMRGRTVGCLPVIDDGRVIGIVTVTDILEQLGRGATRPAVRAERRVRRSPPTSHHQLGGEARTRPRGPRVVRRTPTR